MIGDLKSVISAQASIITQLQQVSPSKFLVKLPPPSLSYIATKVETIHFFFQRLWYYSHLGWYDHQFLRLSLGFFWL